MRLVLHGTDGFDREILEKCIQRGVTKVNFNKVVNKVYMDLQKEGGLGITALMERGTEAMQRVVEDLIDMLGSAGKT